jgi:hypothetical protein
MLKPRQGPIPVASLLFLFLAASLFAGSTQSAADDSGTGDVLKERFQQPSASQAASGRGRALVLGVAGEIKPAYSAFDELHADASIDLTAGAIEFLPYGECRSNIVEGGFLQMTAEGYTAANAKRQGHIIYDCPTDLVLDRKVGKYRGVGVSYIWEHITTASVGPSRHGETNAAAQSETAELTTTRSDIPLTPKPNIVVIGSIGGFVTVVRILSGDQVLLESHLHGRSFKWPKERDPLKAGSHYRLQLMLGDEILRVFDLSIHRRLHKHVAPKVVVISVD